MKPPDAPAGGESVLAWAQEVAACLRALWPAQSPDIMPSVTPFGTTWRNLPSRGAARPSPAPFEAKYGGKDEDAEKVILLVKIGTLADDEPTVTGGEEDAPDGWWKFLVDPSTTLYGVLAATLNSGGSVTARALTLEAEPEVTGPGDSETGEPPEFAYRKIFKIITDADYGAVLTQYTTGAQQVFVAVIEWDCTEITKGAFWLP